jgi:phage baseplate assembly protein W
MNYQNNFEKVSWKNFAIFNRSIFEFEMSDFLESIKDNLNCLFSTQIGERLLEPEYGCDLSDLIFEKLDLTLKTKICNDIRYAIKKFEKRISVDFLSIENEDNSTIKIKILYTTIDLNIKDYFVFEKKNF